MTAPRDPEIALRRAAAPDCARVFAWVNDPDARASSFDARPIAWETHQSWFAALLHDPGRVLYIAVVAGEPIGYVRFERTSPGEAEASIALDPAWRRRGFGARVLRLATGQAARDLRLTAVHASVLPENVPSRRAFLRAGYVETGATVRRGVEALRLTARVSPEPESTSPPAP